MGGLGDDIPDMPGIEEAIGMTLASLAADSRSVRKGDVFLAYPGHVADGRDYIPDAVRAGAGAVLWDPQGFEWKPGLDIPNFPIADLKRHASGLAGYAFGDPSRRMQVIAVTGTEGKTTTGWFLAGLLAAAGSGKCGFFGTVGQGVFGDLKPSPLTTLDAVELQRGIAAAYRAGARSAVIEASSHGISQHRLAGIAYDVAVFTNLGRDHLDYHAGAEEYARSKERLFEKEGLSAAAVNVDDSLGRRLAGKLEGRAMVMTFGSGPARVRLLDCRQREDGMEIHAELDGFEHEWTMRCEGRHNAINALAAMSAARLAGLRWGEMLSAMQNLDPPPGRMQRIGSASRGPAVYVDFAHAPHALERVLSNLRETHAGRRISCVFGCGGDRDPGKRPEMGRIASQHADRVYVTSDNPRGEDPERIIADVMKGANPGARTIPDRMQAIFAAIREADPEDIVLIAGKGHERFQIVGDSELPFDDAKIAAVALQEVSK